jgi:hypothetical protein
MHADEIRPFVGKVVTIETDGTELFGPINRLINERELEILVVIQRDMTWQLNAVRVLMSSIKSVRILGGKEPHKTETTGGNGEGLTAEARQLLLAATASIDGAISTIKFSGGVMVQANRRNFVPDGSSRSRAIWEGAVRELVEGGYVSDPSGKGEIYTVTRKGYELFPKT